MIPVPEVVPLCNLFCILQALAAAQGEMRGCVTGLLW